MSQKQKLKELSKLDFITEDTSNSSIQTSCLMRIAAATEAMAKNSERIAAKYIQMEKDVSFYRNRCTTLLDEIQRLHHSIAGHKAAYTKLKNKRNGQSTENL